MHHTKHTDPHPGVIASLKDIWGGFRQEHPAFVITCLYLVFEYNRPQLVYPALDIIPWGKTLLVLATVSAFFDTNQRRLSTTVLLPLMFFLVCVVMSMVFAISPSVATNEWITFFTWFVVVFLIANVVNSRPRLFLFLTVYFLCNIKMAQHGFRSWAMNGFGFSSWGVTGSPGWFQNSGEFAMEMVVFLPLVLAYIFSFRNSWSFSIRVCFYFLVIMVIGSVIASSSRGAIAGLVVIGVWSLSCSRQRFKTVIVLILLTALAYYVMPPEFKERFYTAGRDKTSISRLTYWEFGKDAIRDNPVFGVGFRCWTIWVAAKHPELQKDEGWEGRVEVIHNTYMEAATELGLLGAVAYILILLQIFQINRRSVRMARIQNDSFLETTAIGLNGCLIGYLAPSYFMSVLYYPYIWVLLALSICVSSVCQKVHTN